MTERECRKSDNIQGTSVKLNDGVEWLIPSLPFSDEGVAIAKLIDEVDKVREEASSLEAIMSKMGEMALAVLGLNYNITPEQIKESSLVSMEHYNDLFNAAMGLSKKKEDMQPESTDG